MLLVGAGAAVYFTLSPGWPADQHLRFVLGDLAPHAVEVRVRCGKGGEGDWVREVTFPYAQGNAPRMVSYEPRLVSGEYLVEIDVKTDDQRVRTIDRHIQLAGGTTSIDLAESGSR
jgi:hypothetical protein